MNNYLKGMVEEPRRYFISEVDEGFYKWDKAITKPELEKRIKRVREMQDRTYDKYIDILLHGEKEPTRKDLQNECPVHNKKRPCPICEPSKQRGGE